MILSDGDNGRTISGTGVGGGVSATVGDGEGIIVGVSVGIEEGESDGKELEPIEGAQLVSDMRHRLGRLASNASLLPRNISAVPNAKIHARTIATSGAVLILRGAIAWRVLECLVILGIVFRCPIGPRPQQARK